jgi:hypothetical protein
MTAGGLFHYLAYKTLCLIVKANETQGKADAWLVRRNLPS